MLKTSKVGTGAERSYGYDGEGHRVRSGSTIFVYDAAGELAAEYGGESSGAGTQFVFADALGSTRLVTDGSGSVLRRHDYYPFGEAILAGVNGRTTAAGYEADEQAAVLG